MLILSCRRVYVSVVSIVKPESLSEMNPQAKVPVFVDTKVRDWATTHL